MRIGIIQANKNVFRNLKRDYLLFDKLMLSEQYFELFLDNSFYNANYILELESLEADIEFLVSNGEIVFIESYLKNYANLLTNEFYNYFKKQLNQFNEEQVYKLKLILLV